MSDVTNILNEPVGKWISQGYLFCPKCYSYEHHPFVFCDHCGLILVREKAMLWHEFLEKTARWGAGPINTIWYLLTKYEPDIESEPTIGNNGKKTYWKLNVKGKEIYSKANKIYSENKGYYQENWPRSIYCGICGGPKKKEGSSYCSELCEKRWEILCKEDGGAQRLAEQLRGGLNVR